MLDRRTRALALALAAAALAAVSTAPAAPFTGLLDDVLTEATNRRTGLGDPPPDDMKPQARALDKVIRIGGKDSPADEKDAKNARRITKVLTKRFAGDGVFPGLLQAMCDGFRARVADGRTQAQADADALPDGKPKKKAGKRLGKVVKFEGKADGTADEAKKLRFLAKALKLLGQIREILDAAPPGGPGDPGPGGFVEFPNAAAFVHGTDLDFDGTMELIARSLSDVVVELSDAIGTPNVTIFAVSPDANRVAYGQIDGADGGFFLVDSNGENRVEVDGFDFGEVLEIEWSHDGSKVAFRAELNGTSQVFVVHRDGTGLVNVSGTVGEVLHRIRWSLDDASLLYHSDRETTKHHELYSFQCNGDPEKQISNIKTDPAFFVYVNFSIAPVTGKLLFRDDRDVAGTYELYSSPADGSAPPKKLSVEQGSTGSVGRDDWRASPDGKQILYRRGSAASGLVALFLYDCDTGKVTTVWDAATESASEYLWSRDGSLFALRVGGDLYVGNGVDPVVPIADFARITDIEFGPESDVIAFLAADSLVAKRDMYVARVDGSRPPVKLTADDDPGATDLAFAYRPPSAGKDGDDSRTALAWLTEDTALDQLSLNMLEEQFLGKPLFDVTDRPEEIAERIVDAINGSLEGMDVPSGGDGLAPRIGFTYEVENRAGLLSNGAILTLPSDTVLTAEASCLGFNPHPVNGSPVNGFPVSSNEDVLIKVLPSFRHAALRDPPVEIVDGLDALFHDGRLIHHVNLDPPFNTFDRELVFTVLGQQWSARDLFGDDIYEGSIDQQGNVTIRNGPSRYAFTLGDYQVADEGQFVTGGHSVNGLLANRFSFARLGIRW